MRFKLLACMLFVAQFVAGCATNYVSQNVGFNHDAYPSYTALYSDGSHLVVSYIATKQGSRESSGRWAIIDMASFKWTPLATINGSKPIEFTPQNGTFKPASGDGLKEISLYTRLYPNPAFNKRRNKPGITAVDFDFIYSGEIHNSAASKFPFTAYEVGPAGSAGDLLLIRDDINHQGQLEAATLVPAKDLSPMMRKIAYPFSVTLDVVTSPVQLIFFVLFVAFYNGA